MSHLATLEIMGFTRKILIDRVGVPKIRLPVPAGSDLSLPSGKKFTSASTSPLLVFRADGEKPGFYRCDNYKLVPR